MFRQVLRLAAFVAVAATVSSALAQKTIQRWTPPRGAHQSVVVSCANPVPLTGAAGGRVAMDDWICPKSGPLVRVRWSGVVLVPNQLPVAGVARRYYVAIWNNLAAACLPGQKLYQACVTPSVKPIGTDCRNRTVYEFTAALPQPYFVQTQGQHYWLQVSEEDASSARVGQEDFRWSGHLEIVNCPAAQQLASGAFLQPIVDDCNPPVADDLAFALYSKTLIGVIVGANPVIGFPIFGLELRDSAGNLIERQPIMPNMDGTFEVEADAPDGQYIATMMGMGAVPRTEPVMVMDGSEQAMSFFDVFYGDLNSDRCVGPPDLGIFLSNWNRGTCP